MKQNWFHSREHPGSRLYNLSCLDNFRVAFFFAETDKVSIFSVIVSLLKSDGSINKVNKPRKKILVVNIYLITLEKESPTLTETLRLQTSPVPMLEAWTNNLRQQFPSFHDFCSSVFWNFKQNSLRKLTAIFHSCQGRCRWKRLQRARSQKNTFSLH